MALLKVNPASLALVDGLVTAILYVCDAPLCAVTTTAMALMPTLSAIVPEALPDSTAVPFTVMLAVASAVVGVKVNEVVPLVTISV